MSLTIELSPELEARLETAARRCGLGKGDLVRHLLEDQFLFDSANESQLQPRLRVLSANRPVKDRSAETEWIRLHQREYAGQYVALDGQRLVAQGGSFAEAAQAARAAGVRDAWVVLIESPDAPPYLGF